MRQFLKSEIGQLLTLFICWRIIVLCVGVLATHFVPYRPDFAYTKFSYYLSQPITGWQTIIEPAANFDGVHYLNIARRGYVDEWRFFPLFPLIIRVLSLENSNAALAAGFVVSQLFSFLALYYLYKLLRFDYSKNISFRVVICMLAFPTSFFLGSVYTEGLFLLLVVTSLYLARKEKWGWAGVAAGLASATRIIGVLLIPVLLIELWVQQKSTMVKQWREILSICIGSLGLILYTLYLWKTAGDPLLFLKAQTVLGNSRSMGLVNPLQTGFRYLKILVTLSPKIYEWWVALLEIGTFCAASVLLWISWNMNIRKSYWWFALLGFAMPVLSGTFTGLPRYVLVLFPLFLPIVLAKQKWILYVYMAIALPCLLLFTALFSSGYFIA